MAFNRGGGGLDDYFIGSGGKPTKEDFLFGPGINQLFGGNGHGKIDPGENQFGVSYGDKSYADKTTAALSRSNFDDYVNNFLPLLEKQVENVGDPVYLEQQRNQARETAGQGLDAAAGIRDQQLRGFGVTPSAEQQAVFDKGDQLRRSRADVTAYNRATRTVDQRDFQVLTGAPRGLDGLTQGGS